MFPHMLTPNANGTQSFHINLSRKSTKNYRSITTLKWPDNTVIAKI